MNQIDQLIANGVLGVDTLWGGDVMCPSGTGRFIADSWFSDEPLPIAYTTPTAAALREAGGVTGKNLDPKVVDEYLKAVNLPAVISQLLESARSMEGLRGAYLSGLSGSLQVMLDLALEVAGKGPKIPYERCVVSSTAKPPEPSTPSAKRERVAELLGSKAKSIDELLAAVDAWRRKWNVDMSRVKEFSGEVIGHFDQLSAKHLIPYLPQEMAGVPRANIDFLPIKDAWFSGSMNYVGRNRDGNGKPKYEATYEINASLQISKPEFEQLVSHEVVPGHVTTFAFLQHLYVTGKIGFEATVLTMNTRAATLFEGIANNAILIAHGVTEVDQLPNPDTQVGVLLALLQDDAKNQSSYLTWAEGWRQEDVAKTLRRDFLVSPERADKLSGAWGKHPLLGRMYLPAYRSGTERVAELRRKYPPEKILPAIYGCFGLVDIETLNQVLPK
jgi:hypothetical protein